MSHSSLLGNAPDAGRVLIISHDVIGSRMAGPGIRYWEMARVLAAQQPVILIAPQPSDLEPPGFRLGHYTWGEHTALEPWLAEADLVIANGYVLQAHPELALIAQPLALDLYDPVLLENLELSHTAPLAERIARTQEDVRLLNAQLLAGDFFLCATERQRDLLIGSLMAAGRIMPERVDGDPQLRRLIDVVPFGLPATPPSHGRPALRGVVPEIGSGDIILLWSGGLWDWLDPLTLIRAMPQVVEHHPTTRLVFLAGNHPGSVATMRRPAEAKILAENLGLYNRHVFFHEEWVPYERRSGFLLESDIAVSLHHQHLETAYAAVRSRFLDHLWAGLPSVVSDGDAAAELVRQHGLGAVVPPGDPQALAAALGHLIADQEARAACASHAAALATTMTWEQCLVPLAAWCRTPARKEQRMITRPTPGAQLHQALDADAERNTMLATLDDSWRVVEPEVAGGLLVPIRRFLIEQFVRPFVVPLLERQNAYNAAATRAMHALAESSDRRRSVYQDQIGGLQQATQQTDMQLEATIANVVAIEQHVLDLDDVDTTIVELLARSDGETPRRGAPET